MEKEFNFDELYRLLGVVVRAKKSSIPESRLIRARVGILCGYHFGPSWESEHRYEQHKLFKQTQDFVIEELFHQCVMRKHYLGYDPERGQLITWVLHYVHYYILNLLKRYKPRDLTEKNRSKLDVYDGRNTNYRMSLEECEEWNLLPASVENPENHLAAKELYLLACSHFSEADFNVIDGKMIRDVVVEKNWNYDAYLKQLQKRRKEFKVVLRTHGYEYFN